MNQRITLLAEQAELYVDLYGKPWPRAMSAEEADAAYKKFAELIVKECCHIMDTTAKKAEENNTYMGDDVPTITHQYKIKQHFGVKE